MFQFIGYSFFSGPNALDSAPSTVENITGTELSNAIFDHFNVTRDTSIAPTMDKPLEWTYDTVLNADFDGNTNAGNLDYILQQISGIKIKRRIKGAFDWLTLKYIDISSLEDLSFTFNDFLNGYNIEYEYAFVPVINGVEGEYIINNVLSKFNGVFIGDAEQVFKFLYGTNYTANSRNQQVGTFMPLGKEYPIIVANGVLSYESGTFTGTLLNDDFEQSGQIDRTAIVTKKNLLKDYLTNKKPKILKDWNGNIWLVMIINNIAVNYLQGSGMGIPQVQFNWIEVGKTDNQQDLYDNGIVDTLG